MARSSPNCVYRDLTEITVAFYVTSNFVLCSRLLSYESWNFFTKSAVCFDRLVLEQKLATSQGKYTRILETNQIFVKRFHIFWEGHKFWLNLHFKFDSVHCSQI